VTSPTAPVTLVVLTYNEERNLPACLGSAARWAAEIFVVDSGSTDGPLRIAEEHGARVVAHPFDTHARQWQWALANLPIATEWVLALDADQRLTPALRDEIGARLSRTEETAGYFVNRKQIFRGRWIRHGGYYPKYLLKLFRRSRVSVDDTELVDHHFFVDGPTERLQGNIIEDNQNEAAIAVWIAKHNRYAVLQARQDWLLGAEGPVAGRAGLRETPDERTRRLKRAWRRLPLFVRPCLYVFYRYVFRLGFLDGKQGFIFHVLQAFWYRLLVDINLDEMASGRDVGQAEALQPGRPSAPAGLPITDDARAMTKDASAR